MPLSVLEKHPGWDIGRNECAACGASRAEIDDNLVTVCEPVAGPHRFALIAIKRAQREAERRAQIHADALRESFDVLSALIGQSDRERRDAALAKAIRAATVADLAGEGYSAEEMRRKLTR